jgi:glycosyltransferase involved in cell wall biosynthesis
MRIVLVEPYYGGSHRAWADGYAASSSNDVTLLTLPARFWKWRMHGAFLTLAHELEADVEAHGLPDVIVVSSMLDVAAFAGAIRSTAPGVPIVVYFHESQFTYPLSPADRTDLTYAMKNWSSAAVADLVVFNSQYHRSVFADAAQRFLNSFPEYTHTHLVSSVMEASIVLPVGVDVGTLLGSEPRRRGTPMVLWNHRWEHDKGPEGLLAIVTGLLERDLDFAMAMCGEVFVTAPEVYDTVADRLGDRLVHRGWIEEDGYRDLLLGSSVVLSTALQEFFGISVVEAIAAGAHPVLPDRLVFPERVAALGADPTASLYDTPSAAVDLIEAALGRPADPTLRASTSRYDWSRVGPAYDRAFSVVAGGSPANRDRSPTTH